ncbi:hypothetical protein GCM10023075_07880 [Streptosporangium album]
MRACPVRNRGTAAKMINRIDSDRVNVTIRPVSTVRRVQIAPTADSIAQTAIPKAALVTPWTASQRRSRQVAGSRRAGIR